MDLVGDNKSIYFLGMLLAALTALGGCGVEPDRLRAFALARPPTEADWSAAVPLRVEVWGGVSSVPGEADVDADSVHKATASCHHGVKKIPVKVELRAFYTPERLFLRLRWGDPTFDRGPLWRWEAGGWKAAPERRDGLGLLWGPPGDARFTCMRACHLKDWRMAGKRAFADYVMAAPGETPLDFWIWRAGRETLEGVAEDAVLTPQGKNGDGVAGAPEASPFERSNSLRLREGKTGVFAEGDAPARAPAPEPGLLVPGFELADRSPGRNEIDAAARHERGGWTVTLSRALAGKDPGDAAFRPGEETLFGLAVLDGVALDHNAAGVPVRLLLAPADAPRRPGAGE